MFHSVGDAYMSASQNNMADVKELIPEFFYLPEFLNNANNYDLGKIILDMFSVSGMGGKGVKFCMECYTPIFKE